MICFREMYHGLRCRNDKRFFAPMAITPCSNVFLGDFVDFEISGVTSIGHVLQFVCHVRCTLSQMCVHYFTLLFQEGQDGIYANVQHHPGTPVNGYVLSETVCIAVCSIKAVLPELQTWALNIFQYQDGCLVRLTDDVSKHCPLLKHCFCRSTPHCLHHIP